MLLTIYDRYGIKKTELSPNDSSVQSKELQSDNMITLTFSLYEHIALDVNDYTDYQGERYWMTETYQPTQKSSVEWEYNVKMYGIESLIKRFLVLNTTDGANEPVFTLTAPPKDHIALVVRCINDGMGGITNWKVGAVESTENIVIDYKGTYCDEALKAIAEAVGTEYWIEGQTVNLCRCEHGEELTIGYGNGLIESSKDMASNVKFYTRLFPIGSTRNIDVDTYGYTRLQLPDKSKYVDINTDKYGIIHHYEADAFAGIYPRRTGTISSVRSEEKKGEDGNMFTIYYIKDDNLPFDPNEFELGGKVKRISFQDGELAGMGEEEDGTFFFECNYDSKTKEFEITTIWPYDDDTQLPGGSLVPKIGNTYILWNIRMPPMYYTLAEEEYRTAVDKYNEDNVIDVAVYKGSTDHVWVEDNNAELFVGRRVKLVSEEYFPGIGYRSSRITKISRNINIPGKVDLEISDALSKGSMDKISNDINDAKNYSKGLLGNMTFPDLIRSWESTMPTDTNIYSARKSEKEFANKSKPATFLELIRFLKGIEVGDAIDSMVSGKGVVVDRNGRIQASRIEVRESMLINELIYNRQSAMEGDFVFTEKGTIEELTELEHGTYTATLRKEWEFDFTALEVDDIVRGIVNNMQSETKEYYTSWCRVVEKDTSANTITIVMYADSEVPGGKNYPPTTLMKLSRWGNTTNEKRRSCWYLSSYEGRIVRLNGVTKPILETWNYSTSWGVTPNFIRNLGLPVNENQDYFYARGAIIQDLLRVDYQGKPLMETVDRGNWSIETASGDNPYLFEAYNEKSMRYENHEVWHSSIKWQCISNGTTEEPRWNSPAWNALSGNFSVSIQPTGGQRFFRGSDVNTVLTAAVYHGDNDISADITDSQVEWSRISTRTDEDMAWNILHANAGLELSITPTDLPSDWLSERQVSFKCKVSIRDTKTVTGEFSINK